MVLRPNYLRVVTVTYLWIGAFGLVAATINRTRQMPFEPQGWVASIIVGATFMAAGVGVIFVPRELHYDAQGFSCRMLVQGSHAFGWEKLEAYGSGNNVFLLKFEGRQAIQISGFGFRRAEWKEFKGFLKRTFPDKSCSFWLGPKPIMRKR